MLSGKISYRLVIFVLAIIFGVGYSLPTFLQSDKGAKIALGLDLQGGLHMVLGVQTEEAIKSKVKSIASSIKFFAQSGDIIIDDLKIDEEMLTFTLLDKDEEKKIDEMLKTISGLEVSKESLRYTLSLNDKEKDLIREYAISQAVETIRNRLDQFGLAEPNVSKQGTDKIVVELPGIKTAEDEQRARELIAKAAHLQLMAVDEKRKDRTTTMSPIEAAQYGDVILPDARSEQVKHILKEIPVLDGSMLSDAKVAFSDMHQPVINFTLNSEGAKIFGDFTANNIGNRLAIVLDNKVYSDPVIRERIGGGSGQISGGFSVKEAHDVAIALRSGALLAPVTLLEKRSVGPSLGADSIQASSIALISGFFLIVGFLILYYHMAGVFASFALLVNFILLIAIMALFGATLTLPGMAGIVLSLGMAVDANVIINERIRELLRQGIAVRQAVEKGYENAMSAIVDGNLTLAVSSVILYVYGTGPIKGFAISMLIGNLISMLTAILGTHGIYELLMSYIEKNHSIRFWFGMKKRGH
ncbi:protein translocase subunit SecD [Sulfurospirillum multivorans]|uniref:Protein translocase subunit SecD n=2 Tax=Sulfurospirillum multivorans TaxID=66821 RepID=A0AA86E373_SULMK|nr:protein translocase subunit SecD [Sulfurospirillum multivorans]AHJ13512.1 protein-export membrane protein SecD [Sulfurospirillum multivorans DSM 12446]QEH07002.1 protein-export membrane protein SecD [Sulfurospirillum multivorans]